MIAAKRAGEIMKQMIEGGVPPDYAEKWREFTDASEAIELM